MNSNTTTTTATATVTVTLQALAVNLAYARKYESPETYDYTWSVIRNLLRQEGNDIADAREVIRISRELINNNI